MFETFDHTADIGLRVRANDLPTLLTEAAHGLLSVILQNPESVEPRQTVTIEIVDDDLEFLLFDWLRALLYHCDADHLVFCRTKVHLSTDATGKITGLTGTAWGEILDPNRHWPGNEVKAITYHGLSVEQPPEGGWQAEVILDI